MKKLISVLTLCLGTLQMASAAPGGVERDAGGVTLTTAAGVTRVEIWGDRIVRVTHRPPAAEAPRASLAVIARPDPGPWEFAEQGDEILLTTARLRVAIDETTAAVRFLGPDARPILGEIPGGTALTPAAVGADRTTWRCEQRFALDPAEAIYGLGQHPNGLMDYRGAVIHEQQANRDVAVPVLVSSRGYGVLWDNPAVTDVDVGKSDPQALTWTSEAGRAVDYYFLQGPALDDVVAGYRFLTGAAPLMAHWTWGFWQCRERYQTQAELLGVVAEYRHRGLPLDGIIQDWQYWPAGQWGSHTFDPARYPDPTAMVAAVHAAHAHLIISVWPRFDLGTTHLAELEQAGAVYPPVFPNVYPKGEGKWYDPFNPAGRRLYWEFLSDDLFARGIDGWWMDASEAELGGRWGEMRDLQTGAGPGAEVYNAYPLMHSTGVYQGQRAETSARRVFILTRSAYAGQQRNAAVTWSGDTTGTWDVFRQQIPAGLNFSLSGIPYWNTDIGGFFAGDPADPKYAELFTRWFQFGAFCPMFRVHGTGKPKEVWRFDAATQRILADTIALRYRLLPYLYSVSWQVTSAGATMLRPLVMDFPADPRVRTIGDQFLFGPALLVNPVTAANAVSREVYLPAGTSWIDFWTGAAQAGGQAITAAAPIERLPLFVRAGSILPLGPAVQYADEQPADPLELRVYRGADGRFTLYEDAGDGYGYEQGARATISFQWDERRQTLTIGQRQGDFPGMLRERTFRIVWVSPGHGVGVSPAPGADVELRYTGGAVTVPGPTR